MDTDISSKEEAYFNTWEDYISAGDFASVPEDGVKSVQPSSDAWKKLGFGSHNSSSTDTSGAAGMFGGPVYYRYVVTAIVPTSTPKGTKASSYVVCAQRKLNTQYEFAKLSSVNRRITVFSDSDSKINTCN